MVRNALVVIGMAWMLTTGTAWAQQLNPGAGSFGGDELSGIAKEAATVEAARRESAAPMLTWPEPRRPAALPVLYASLGVMQALDVYSTSKALSAGAREQNPMMAQFAGNKGAMIAYKAAMTAGTIAAVENMWKKNRVGAVLMAIAANGVTAAVAAHNVRVARAQRAR